MPYNHSLNIKSKVVSDDNAHCEKWYSKVSLENLISMIITDVNNFFDLPPQLKAHVLYRLPKQIQKQLLNKLSIKSLVDLLQYLDPDEIADIIALLTKVKRRVVLSLLSHDRKNKVEYLLRFDPRSAAGIMSLNFILVEIDDDYYKILKRIRDHEKRTGKIPVVLVYKNEKLLGELMLSKFLLSNHIIKDLKEYVKPIPTISYNAKKHDIIRTFFAHKHDKVAVLDENEHIIGVIFSDDLINLIAKKGDNLYSFAALNQEEDVLDNFFIKFKNRYGWLILNLGTAFLASFVISLFQDVISKNVLLAVYMPIIAGMGGNAATQTLAVIVRGLTLHEIKFSNFKYILLNEILASLMNGAINGIIVALVAYLFHQNPMLGLVLFLAMIINLFVAAFFGSIIPVILKALGKDPASSATIFITTATDVFGFFSFLGLAKLLL